MNTTYILTSSITDELSLTALGGKAKNLCEMTQQGFPVPNFFCVSTHAFSHWIGQKNIAELENLVLDLNPQSPKTINRIQRLLSELPFNTEIKEEIYAAFDEMFEPGSLISVRSSGIGEDSSNDSFAGQMDTYLNVNRDTLIFRIIQCFCSAFSTQAITYRKERNLPLTDIKLAVIVQRMVISEKSGVLFSSNPITNDHDSMVITSGYGLGEGVVTDQVEADTYYLAKQNGNLISQDIATKTQQVVRDQSKNYDTEIRPVEKTIQDVSSLSQNNLLELYRLALAIERHYKKPQDIEWAFDNSNTLYLLQARPITTMQQGQKRIFDNSNIVEGYPGITTPLTFSIARMGYAIVFKNTAKVMGATRHNIEQNKSTFDNMIGYIQGRIYYQISNWYTFYRLVPGMSKNIAVWERSLGLPATNLEKDNPRGIVAFLGSAKLTLSLLYQFITIDRKIANFHSLFKNATDNFGKLNVSQLEPDQALDLFDELQTTVLSKWECTTINDFCVFKSFASVESLIKRFGLSEHKNLIGELLANQPNMESVAPVKSALQISDQINNNKLYRTLFTKNRSANAIWATIQNDPEYTELYQHLTSHIKKYGDRTVQELKLETPSLSENPDFLISILQSYVNSGRNLAELESNMDATKSQAERYVEDTLSNSYIKKTLFNYALKRCRIAMVERENLRFSRTRAFGIIKTIFRQIAKQWVASGIIKDLDDIFFLTHNEIAAYIRGSSVTIDLQSLVELRRTENNKYSDFDPADRVTTYGTVYANRFPQSEKDAPSHSSVLNGTGCSSGKLTAPAKVITDPLNAGDVSGCILVAEMTDPGWVFLMVAAKGLIVERGNILSHTAIIGRELGIPTIIGVDKATRCIQDGDMITMDGEHGTITIETETQK
ncbi:MAG: hypothetical protein COA42_14285 [Alteromonadaceae bacterium]|nr:MAG: hypothetical protein COA42_14285 [Alteromonadaceae bacterium]